MPIWKSQKYQISNFMSRKQSRAEKQRLEELPSHTGYGPDTPNCSQICGFKAPQLRFESLLTSSETTETRETQLSTSTTKYTCWLMWSVY